MKPALLKRNMLIQLENGDIVIIKRISASAICSASCYFGKFPNLCNKELLERTLPKKYQIIVGDNTLCPLLGGLIFVQINKDNNIVTQGL